MEIDNSAGNCDGECVSMPDSPTQHSGPIVIEVADWKPGNPVGHYCQHCGYVFGYEGGRGPRP